MQLQASLALVQNPGAASTAAEPDEFGRVPFTHPALDGLKNLSGRTKSILTDRSKLGELAQKYKMLEVLRWAPKQVRPLSRVPLDGKFDANYWDSPKISPRLALTWCWRSPYTRWLVQSRWKRAASLPTKWRGSGSSSHWASKGRSCCERLQHFHGVFLIFPGWTGGNHHGCICTFRKLFSFLCQIYHQYCRDSRNVRFL